MKREQITFVRVRCISSVVKGCECIGIREKRVRSGNAFPSTVEAAFYLGRLQHG